MAARVGSARIWSDGNCVGHPLVESGNFPNASSSAVCTFHRNAGRLGCFVGGILGKPLLDPARVRNSINAALRGAAIASLALLLFAPMFATLYVLTQAPREHWNIANLTLLILIGSAFVIWWLVALI